MKLEGFKRRSRHPLRFLAAMVAALASLGLTGCERKPSAFVVVYTSQDQVHAEPILRAFAGQTSIEVRPVYDSEAVKTVGLANRLLAEKSNPQCDVFWSNEELRTRQLVAQGVFDSWSEIGWAQKAFRLRQMVVNTNRLSLDRVPKSVVDLTNAVWRGKVAVSYPLFGTTATHFLALRQHWGEVRWLKWCQALQANQPFVVDGNSVVVQLVGRGEAWIGLTDSDDIRAGQREGLPIAARTPVETLRIPNTVALVKSAPRTGYGSSLVAYLQRDWAVNWLVRAGALERVAAGSPGAQATGLAVDWDALLRDLDPATEQLRTIFLR